MKEIIARTFRMYPDHEKHPYHRKDWKNMFAAACPDCKSEVFTIRIIEHHDGLVRFFGDCISCDHQCILGEYDPNKEVED